MFYTVYKITNVINGKEYIGKHITNSLDDGYMGSGKLLLRAIAKYGIENFKKEILYIFDSDQEMNDKEKELVTEEYCNQINTYNLCPGGNGGFGYINSNSLNGTKLGVARRTELFKDEMWKADRNEKLNIGHKKFRESEKYRKSIEAAKETRKRLYGDLPGTFTGKSHTLESKQKISNNKKGLFIGSNNSQFGTMWITDGTQNLKIKNTDDIPINWYRGRTC